MSGQVWEPLLGRKNLNWRSLAGTASPDDNVETSGKSGLQPSAQPSILQLRLWGTPRLRPATLHSAAGRSVCPWLWTFQSPGHHSHPAPLQNVLVSHDEHFIFFNSVFSFHSWNNNNYVNSRLLQPVVLSSFNLIFFLLRSKKDLPMDF